MRVFEGRVLPRGWRGVAAVEMALVIPIFLFLTIATAELGRALYQYNTLTKAVRDAAQYLARNAVTPAGVVSISGDQETTARNLVVYGTPTGTGPELLPGFADQLELNEDAFQAVEVVVAPSLTANYVTVTASYTFDALFEVIPGFFVADDVAAPGTMTASVTLRGL